MAENNKRVRQHEAIRVPQGWTGQDKALIIQLERMFNSLYALIDSLEQFMVTDINYDSENRQLTLTVGKESKNIISIATESKDGFMSHEDKVALNGKADKSETVTNVSYDSANAKVTKTINGSTTDVVSVLQIKSALGAFTHDQLAGL